MGNWKEEDHPRGYHGHFISKVAEVGAIMFDATKAAGSELASRAKQVGAALKGASLTMATAVPAVLGIYGETLLGRFKRNYRRGPDPGAQKRDDYGKLPAELADTENMPEWLMPFTVEVWNHILDGHSPESTYRNTDKFVDGSTEAIVRVILGSIPEIEPDPRFGRVQGFKTQFPDQMIKVFLEYNGDVGKWEITSVHPFTGDFISDHFKRR